MRTATEIKTLHSSPATENVSRQDLDTAWERHTHWHPTGDRRRPWRNGTYCRSRTRSCSSRSRPAADRRTVSQTSLKVDAGVPSRNELSERSQP